MARRSNTDLITTVVSYNGETEWAAIERQMVELFDEVGLAYASKKNRSLSVIASSLRKANEVIYREVLVTAPVIDPQVYLTQNAERREASVRSRKYTIERSAHGKKWMKAGIVARRVVTFKDPVSTYVAALEFGRDEFTRFTKPKMTSQGATFSTYTVGAAKAQPFLIPALQSKRDQALSVFSSELKKRWMATLRRLNRRGVQT